MGFGGRILFLASLLFAPARSQLRQPDGVKGRPKRDEILAGARHRRLAAGRHSLSRRAGGYKQREPSRNPRSAEADPRGARLILREPSAARRSQSMARGYAGIFRAGRRMPYGVSLPAYASHVHGY